MTITERYLHLILPSITVGIEGASVKEKTFNGLTGYEFPCPFCSQYRSKEHKKRIRCAALVPQKESFSYQFMCFNKGASECKKSSSFPVFLKMYNPSLYNRYHQERDIAGSTGGNSNIPKYNYFKKQND